MKPHLGNRAEAGLTLPEVVVIIVIMLLVALFWTALHPYTQRRASKVNCTNNLKQLGLAYRIWEDGNGDIYPMGVSTKNGGSMEMVATGDVVQTFAVMSNEISSVKILVCPNDRQHSLPAENGPNSMPSFAQLSRSNISYFVGIDVTNEANPQFILSGDSDFEIAAKPVEPGLRSLWTNDPVTWSAGRHAHWGNVGLADGSVQVANDTDLHNFLIGTGAATNRLAIP